MRRIVLSLLGRTLLRFRRGEDGSLLVFGLFLFATFFLMSGMAVDLMRTENRRTALSQSLDRCALNAAALRQTLDPATVVRDCVDRDGLLPHLTEVKVTNSAGQRSVEVKGEISLETMFMHASGVDVIDVNARSVAEQRATNIEIVLVLDVSGSMEGSKLSSLKTSAKNFVSTVLANNTNRISIAIVPYNGQVNLGSSLRTKFNVTHASGLTTTVNGDMRTVNCVDMPSSVYNNTGISRTLAMPATGWADAFTSLSSFPTTHSTNGRTPNQGNVWCPPSSVNVVRLQDDSISAMHTYIDNLVAIGATSINAGMKWGGALLDPQFRTVVNEYVDAGTIPPEFRDRPFDYTKRDALKIVVLMTDGENFGDVRLNDAYRVGDSPIFKGTDGNYSIQFTSGRPASAGANQFWVPHTNDGAGQWRSTAWSSGTRMTWQQVWQELNVSWTAWHMYARALGTSSSTRSSQYSTWYGNFRTQRGDDKSTPAMDAELQQICTLTKQQGVLIYGIAFSAPTRGINAVKGCASSDGHFFNSTSTNQLNAAFQAIATNITQLRLVN
ncbi:VWA domain-containing protein [Paragemmobacter ruber]|uniref:VWA domain-containing protein n=1 Tax=Paragemmobacter ruber TaxID=1985673 RepID=A0ABW9Y3C2_9RHOB|nr:VWA domain-containing protein [Rhodobacter ruber]NBE06380.1 VWA domain-containing protein [Rhodobacter ruber]